MSTETDFHDLPEKYWSDALVCGPDLPKAAIKEDDVWRLTSSDEEILNKEDPNDVLFVDNLEALEAELEIIYNAPEGFTYLRRNYKIIKISKQIISKPTTSLERAMEVARDQPILMDKKLIEELSKNKWYTIYPFGDFVIKDNYGSLCTMTYDPKKSKRITNERNRKHKNKTKSGKIPIVLLASVRKELYNVSKRVGFLPETISRKRREEYMKDVLIAKSIWIVIFRNHDYRKKKWWKTWLNEVESYCQEVLLPDKNDYLQRIRAQFFSMVRKEFKLKGEENERAQFFSMVRKEFKLKGEENES